MYFDEAVYLSLQINKKQTKNSLPIRRWQLHVDAVASKPVFNLQMKFCLVCINSILLRVVNRQVIPSFKLDFLTSIVCKILPHVC